MNTRVLTTIITLVLTAQADVRLDAAELIGHWKFDANGLAVATDLSGHGRDAALQLGPQNLLHIRRHWSLTGTSHMGRSRTHELWLFPTEPHSPPGFIQHA